MKRRPLARHVSLMALAAMLEMAGGTAAAEAPPLGNESELIEIVVTAQKRSEKLQDVPLAMTAATAEQLDRQHVTQFQELRFIDPSVSYTMSSGPNTSAFAVRGVGTASFSVGVEQSVSTVLDGVVLDDPTAVADLADVQRVEVLRGPQGMLFGKNASAGVVSITTNDPTLEAASADLRLGYGENDERLIQAIANAPLGDKVALRLVVSHNHLDGWVRSVPLNRDLDEIDSNSVRGKLLFQPTDDLRILLSGDYSDSDAFCCQWTVRATPTTTFAVPLVNQAFGITAGRENFETAVTGQERGYSRLSGGSLDINYDLPSDFTITSITAYRSYERANIYDADSSVFNFADRAGGIADIWNLSQELRVTSPVGGFSDFVAGLYYYERDANREVGNNGFFALPAPGTIEIPPANQVLRSLRQTADVHGTSAAIFGQANVHLTEALTFLAGGRYTHDRGRLDFTTGVLDTSLPLVGGYPATGFAANGYIGATGPYVTPCVTPAQAVSPAQPNCFPAIQQNVGADNFSWKVGLKNEFTPDVMGYVTVSRGYKGPGFSAVNISPLQVVAGAADQRVRPEIPMSYEIGFKSQFWDRRVQLNVDAFDVTYKNFQAQVSQQIAGLYVSKIANAGKVKSRGAEMSLSMRATEDLTANLSAAYVHARYGDFQGVPCYAVLLNAQTGQLGQQPGCVAGLINAKGKRVAGAPELQYQASLDYERSDAIRSLTLLASLNWSWSGSVQYTANGDPATLEPSYGLLGGGIGVASADEKWKFTIYGSNLLDKHWASNIIAGPTQALNPGGSVQFLGTQSFRHVGARVDMHF